MAPVQASELAAYVDNVLAMLRLDERKFGLAVDRQVTFALLPRLRGSRASLEEPLWRLLALCSEGPSASVDVMSPEARAQLLAAATSGQRPGVGEPARFPAAARGVASALAVLQEHGVYPAPKLSPPARSESP